MDFAHVLIDHFVSMEIFAFFMLTGIFSTLLLPETKQKSLEELSNEDQEGFIKGPGESWICALEGRHQLIRDAFFFSLRICSSLKRLFNDYPFMTHLAISLWPHLLTSTYYPCTSLSRRRRRPSYSVVPPLASPFVLYYIHHVWTKVGSNGVYFYAFFQGDTVSP